MTASSLNVGKLSKSARRADEKEKQLHELELKRLELELQEAKATSVETQPPAAEASENFSMNGLMQPFQVGEDIGMSLVNFERTCQSSLKRRVRSACWTYCRVT